jgi:hypothetical protein
MADSTKQYRALRLTFGGVERPLDAGSNVLRDAQMQVRYFEIYNNADHDFVQASAKTNYSDLMNAVTANVAGNSDLVSASSPVVQNYYVDSDASSKYGVVSAATGIYPLGSDQPSLSVSLYRREYNKYTQPSSGKTATVVGQWEPVSYAGIGSHIRDMNVQSGHSYQYIAYPSSLQNAGVYATNTTVTTSGGANVIGMGFPCWSLTELTEITGEIADTPTIKHVYKADLDNVWLLKFGAETGAETQNIARSEIQTLGTYPKYSQGQLNAGSGTISCWLGSEVIPFDGEGGYIERLRPAIDDPASTYSTNQGAAMLKAWKKFVYSKNPKLLKDMKGQSWIVQIDGASATASNYIYGQPTQISFSWKQVASRDSAVIYAEGATVAPTQNQAGSRWYPVYDT